MLLLLLYLFIGFSTFSPPGDSTIESRIATVNHLPGKSQRDSVLAILKDLEKIGGSQEEEGLKNLLSSRRLLPEASVLTLIQLAKAQPQRGQKLLDSCLSIIREEQLNELLPATYIAKSDIYKLNYKFDSAMIAVLEAQSYSEDVGTLDDKANISQLIADLYFHVGRYDEAEAQYSKLQTLKGDLNEWESWRKRVVRNNFGLIALEKNQFEKAEVFFRESRKELDELHLTSSDSIYFAYLLFQISECYLRSGCLKEAHTLSDSVMHIYNSLNNERGTIRTAYLKARLAVAEKDYPSLRNWLKVLDSKATQVSLSKDEQLKIVLLRAVLMKKFGRLEDALTYTERYAQNQYEYLKANNKNRIHQIETEYAYDSAQWKIKSLQNQKAIFITFLVAVISFLVIVLRQYLILRQKDYMLVSLSVNEILKKKKAVSQSPTPSKSDLKAPTSSTSDHQRNEMMSLIEKFMTYLTVEKPYLNSSVTINDISKQLGTNRSYLSKAINFIYGQNFNLILNAFRINDAIHYVQNYPSHELNFDQLATQSGFGSRSSFNAAFSKLLGTTPSAYLTNPESLAPIDFPALRSFHEAQAQDQTQSIAHKDSSHFHTTGTTGQSEQTVAPATEEMQSSELVSEFSILMESDELFLQADLTIADVAKKLATNRTYLSHAINSEFGEGFKDVLNRYRVEYSKDLIINQSETITNLEAIAMQSGFGSRSSFDSSFKKFTGVTPASFARNYLQIVSKNRP